MDRQAETQILRSVERIESSVKKSGERIASALEKMANAPPIDLQDSVPFFCPHCGQVNPEITTFENKGSGPAAQLIIIAECHSCNKQIYAVPTSWAMFENAESLRAEMENPNGRG